MRILDLLARAGVGLGLLLVIAGLFSQMRTLSLVGVGMAAIGTAIMIGYAGPGRRRS